MKKLIRIDFDDVKYRILEAQTMLHNLKPVWFRVSSGKKGFHIIKFTDISDEDRILIQEFYDDPNRHNINMLRRKAGLSWNRLFDMKCRNGKVKVAGEWQLLNDGYDVEMSLNYWRV